MLDQFPYHAIPLACGGIACTVFPIGNKVEEIVEADLFRDALQNVDAKTVETAVSREVLPRVHHDVRHFLHQNTYHAHAHAVLLRGTHKINSPKSWRFTSSCSRFIFIAAGIKVCSHCRVFALHYRLLPELFELHNFQDFCSFRALFYSVMILTMT